MRLNKFLALCGVASRRKCDEIILSGIISVNNQKITKLGTTIDEKKDIIKYNDNIITLPSNYVYFKLNKPKGYITTVSDEHNRKTVMDLIKTDVRIFPVGRLDYDSEGLILLTNDGEVANKLTHPSNEVEKTYIVKIEGNIKESELAVLRNGVVIDGEKFGKSKVKLLSFDSNKNESRLEIKIKEGRNREIRRMFEHIGKTIILLKRISIGKIKLGNLNRGEYRPLNKEELIYLATLGV